MPPPPGSWDEEDEWWSDTVEGTRHVRPRARSRARFLAPETTHTVHLQRTRSHGHSPAPQISIYNTVDDHGRVTQTTPSPRGSPRGRSHRVVDDIDDLELEELRLRARSRSRGRLFQEQTAGYERMQLELANERLRERDRERRDEEFKDLVRKEYEYKKEKERRKREEKEREEAEEKKRILTEEQLKIELSRKEAEEERRRIIAEENLKVEKAKKEADDLKAKARAEWERQDKEAKEERRRAVEAWENKRRREEAEEELERKAIIAEYEAKKLADSRKAEEEEKAWRLKIKLEDEARKEKEKKEYEEFVRKQREKEEEEKRKLKEKEDAIEDEMTKRLAVAGFQNNQIQAIIKPDKHHGHSTPGMTPANPLPWHQPTYIKVHRDHIAIETLSFFDIPWEYDRDNREYIIILREMDTTETNMLFEHTRTLRSRGTDRLLIEGRRDRGKPEYAWVRHRSKSKSPARKRSPKRVVGIKEMFF